jgi:bisphosphoglycerate-dependent phosphoglycerate mutase
MKQFFTSSLFYCLFFLTGILVVQSSCRTAKKIQVAISKNDTAALVVTDSKALDSMKALQGVIAEIKKTQIDFKTFTAKIKVEYQDSKGKQPNITAYTRILKDSLIWISGYATVFNVEAFRLLITKDSFFLMDKLNKEYQSRSIDYLQEVTQIPFTLITLQNLIVGNLIFYTDSIVSYKENDNNILVSTIGEQFKNLITINKSNKQITHSKLDDADIARSRTADIIYDD